MGDDTHLTKWILNSNGMIFQRYFVNSKMLHRGKKFSLGIPTTCDGKFILSVGFFDVSDSLMNESRFILICHLK